MHRRTSPGAKRQEPPLSPNFARSDRTARERLHESEKWCDHEALISLRPHLYLHLSLRGAVIALVWVALLSASMMVWLEVGRTLRHPKPVQLAATTKPTAMAWGDRVFQGRSHLKAWLEAHGVTYAAWARRHPAAAQIVDPHAIQPIKAVPKKVAARTAGSHVERKSKPGPTPSRIPGRGAIFKSILIALLALLLGFAILPSRFARLSRRLGLPAGLRPEQRFYAVAAAVAILTGIVAGSVIN